jgi:DNA polymerase III gamma/tau subunit
MLIEHCSQYRIYMIESTMTYLLINKSKDVLKDNLLLFVNRLLGKKYENIEDIYSVPDIHILDNSSKNSIGIEDVKALQKEMVFKPFGDGVQIAIILESEKLTQQAQNSLLKTLEDSEDSSIYLLCVNNEKNLLQTIISRAKPIYLNGVHETEEIGTDIFEKDLLEQFQTIEKISKSKTESLGLINSIENIYKKKLEIEIKNGNIDSSMNLKRTLEQIAQSRKKINSNCNKKLVLEALIVSLNA